jgi:uncharacterized protein YbjQ (UPF0145 family)
MLITTTDTLQGSRIERYLGLVAGHSVLGEGLTKKFRTGIRDVGSGYPHDYSQELDKAREAAVEQLSQRAVDLGANAVVGVSIVFGMSGDTARMVIVSASGTAVAVAVESEGRSALRRVEPAGSGAELTLIGRS